MSLKCLYYLLYETQVSFTIYANANSPRRFTSDDDLAQWDVSAQKSLDNNTYNIQIHHYFRVSSRRRHIRFSIAYFFFGLSTYLLTKEKPHLLFVIIGVCQQKRPKRVTVLRQLTTAM